MQINLTMKNNGYDKVSSSPIWFNLITNNISYSSDSTSYVVSDKLESVDILNGGTLTGSLVFQIPQSVSSAPFTMDYSGYCTGLEKCNIIWSKV